MKVLHLIVGPLYTIHSTTGVRTGVEFEIVFNVKVSIRSIHGCKG